MGSAKCQLEEIKFLSLLQLIMEVDTTLLVGDCESSMGSSFSCSHGSRASTSRL